MKQLREQADFDQSQYDATKLHPLAKKDQQEFSDRGRADLKVRRNDPRFADNPMSDERDLLDEFAGQSLVDRLHQILSNAGISDQQVKGEFNLKDDGLGKISRRLGISPQEVQVYLHTLQQQLRDESEDDVENQLLLGSLGSIREQYYNAVNVIDENEPEAGQPDRPFVLDEDEYKKQGYNVVGHPGRYFWIKRSKGSDTFHDEIMHGTAKTERDAWDDLRRIAKRKGVGEARFSYEPDALGSMTVRDANTGQSTFVQGAQASRAMAQLKKRKTNRDAILGPLVEKELADTPTENSFWSEIDADAGSYNFMWKIGGQHGMGTAMFHAEGGPNLELVDVRDATGNEIDADAHMHRELLQQARAFLGKE